MTRRLLAASLLAAVCLLAPAAGAAPSLPSSRFAPQALSAAEWQAALLAAEYLYGGPEAWWLRLARGAALRRLGHEAAVAEIEVRAGPPQGARWELLAASPSPRGQSAVFALEFPSGVDDTLTLDLAEEAGDWKIAGLRVSAEPAFDRQLAAPAPAGAPPESDGRNARRLLGSAALTLAAALLAAAALARARLSQPVRRALAGTGCGLLALAAALLWPGAAAGPRETATAARQAALDPTGRAAAGGAAPAGEGELRGLLPLRRALTQARVGSAAGSDGGALPAAAPAAGIPAHAAALRTARLWRAQYLLGQSDLAGAEAELSADPVPNGVRLAELLRARLGLLRLQETSTVAAYRRAIEAGPPDEGLLLEAAGAFAILGYDDHAKEYLARLQRLGARSPDAYYLMAEFAVLDDRLLAAHDSFVTGWNLQPVPRGDLLERSLMAALLDDGEIRGLVRLDSAVEPPAACTAAPRPLPLPPGAEPLLTGSTLHLSRGDSELLLRHSCELAPAGTRVETAEGWQQRQRTKALAGLAALTRAAQSPGALASPALRRQTEQAAEALADTQRWPELVELTARLASEGSILPGQLSQLRAVALERLGRTDEAQRLLIRLALGDRSAHRANPSVLYQLARLVEEAGDFDHAIRLVTKANSQLPRPASNQRVVQLQLERRLARSSAVYSTPAFRIRYPALRGEEFARDAARVLEEQKQRLRSWVPAAAAGPPIEVHLLPASDFWEGYSQGGGVLGLFDGKIRVPLGDVGGFGTAAVSLLSHELAHALISQRTGGRAPHWFQEGLAQTVELTHGRLNPIPSYHARGTLVAFPLVEPTLRGFASPEWITIAYDEALWSMHYIETRYGRGGIHRLLDAFEAGKSSEEALAVALGVPMPDFDRDLWGWCLGKAPAHWSAAGGP